MVGGPSFFLCFGKASALLAAPEGHCRAAGPARPGQRSLLSRNSVSREVSFKFIPCVFGVASRCERSCLPFWQGEGSPCHPTSLARGPDACLVSMTGVRFWGFQLVLSASPLIRSASPGLHSTVHRPPVVIPKSRFTVFPARCFQLCRPGGPFLWPPFLSCASELFVSAKCI